MFLLGKSFPMDKGYFVEPRFAAIYAKSGFGPINPIYIRCFRIQQPIVNKDIQEINHADEILHVVGAHHHEHHQGQDSKMTSKLYVSPKRNHQKHDRGEQLWHLSPPRAREQSTPAQAQIQPIQRPPRHDHDKQKITNV